MEGPAAVRPGRPPSTSVNRLEAVAFELFARKGFDETTIDDVASAAGISRRTFFRYYRSKNDLVWGEFDVQLVAFRQELARLAHLPMMDALRLAVVAFNRLDDDGVEAHRSRMRLILGVPALQAHSTLRYASWRAVVQEFVADRTGAPTDALLPRLVGHVALATSVTAYEQWLAAPGSDLSALLDEAFARIAQGFQA